MTKLPDRLATFRAAGKERIGVVRDDGIVDLTGLVPCAGLKEAIEAGALAGLVTMARDRAADFA